MRSCLLCTLVVCLGVASSSAQAPAAAGKALTPDQSVALLKQARARYYSLSNAGVQSYACDAEIDWPAFFNSLGVNKPADDPFLKYLEASRIHFVAPMAGSPTLEWKTTAKPPAGMDLNVEQLQVGFKTMLEGFLMGWTPSQNGTLIPEKPASMVETGNGYAMTDTQNGGTAHLSVAKDLLLTHISFSSNLIKAEIDPGFEPSAHGLLLKSFTEDYSQPASAPSSHVVMETSYSTVSGVQIPNQVTLSVPTIKNLKIQFTGCVVQKK